MSSAKGQHVFKSLNQAEKETLRKLLSTNENGYRVPKCIEAVEALFLDFKDDINLESVKKFGYQLMGFHRQLQAFKAVKLKVEVIQETANRFDDIYFDLCKTFYNNPCVRPTFYKIYDMLMHEYYTALKESQEKIKKGHNLEANTFEESPALLHNITEQFKSLSKDKNYVSEQLKNISEQLKDVSKERNDGSEQLKNMSKERVDILKQLQYISKELNEVSDQLKNISEQLKSVSKERNDVTEQLKGLSKERVDILKRLQDISKERIELNQRKIMSNEKQNVTEQLTNISEQLGNVLKEKNDLSDLFKDILKEKNDISEQLKKMSRERCGISEQLKKLSEFSLYQKSVKQLNESTIIKEQKKSHVIETTPTTSPTQTTSTTALCTCTLQMASKMPSHILGQQCNEAKVNTTSNEKSSNKDYNDLLENYSDLKEQESGQFDVVVFPGSSLPSILLNACYNIFTQWRSAYSQTELTIFFTIHLRNLNSNLFLECATELSDVKKTTLSNSGVVDKKWALILSGALKQWLSARLS